jgi:tyrosine-specific transport protein
MIAGTTIGAGMLGIPLLTAKAGFTPAFFITAVVWLFMLATGLLFLEVSLWMPPGSNLLSMASRFLGRKGKLVTVAMFLFLYMTLMVAYFAAGAPLLTAALNSLFGLSLGGWQGCLFFGLLFSAIVSFGARVIDRTNIILTVAMVAAYFSLIKVGSSEVKFEQLTPSYWPGVFIALPVLFSAFGYHNVIPPLCTYLKKDRRALQLSIIIGTTIPLVMYVLWQWLIIGSIPIENISAALLQGQPATGALQAVTGKPYVFLIGQFFAFFALVTSLLGVSFSLVDFLGDALKVSRSGFKGLALTLLVFVPPFIFTLIDPAIFDRALGYAGGFGEAFLNGLLPVTLVWLGRYKHKLSHESCLPGGKALLITLFVFALFVMGLEAFLSFF